MTLDYFEPEMDEIEKRKYIPFVGYINPRGQLIDYTTLIGYQTHYSTKNPASMLFLQFVSYIIKDFSPNELKFFWDEDFHIYKNNKTEGYDYVVKRGYNYYNNYNVCSYEEFLKEIDKYYNNRENVIRDQINSAYSFWDMPVYENLQNDLMEFFKKAYTNKDFFKSIGMTFVVDSFDNYIEKQKGEIAKKMENTWFSNYKERNFYNDYQIKQLMSYFKDIMVQYLGYDSIERRLKIGTKSFKVITTSSNNINERFYNWLLMDWNIYKVPKMIWNEKENKFVKERQILSLYQTEKEEILGKEIESIKKEIPKQYRKKYFRK